MPYRESVFPKDPLPESVNATRPQRGLHYIPTPTPGRLAILPRPRGGDWLDADIAAWARAGFETIVSLLTADEEGELGLENESLECEREGLSFVSFPVPDRGVPATTDDFTFLVTDLVDRLRAGRTVGVHCRQGIGRSGLAAVSVLRELGVPTADAIRTVSDARGVPVPETPAQLAWLRRPSPVTVGK